jgi:hypothetical protein
VALGGTLFQDLPSQVDHAVLLGHRRAQGQLLPPPGGEGSRLRPHLGRPRPRRGGGGPRVG